MQSSDRGGAPDEVQNGRMFGMRQRSNGHTVIKVAVCMRKGGSQTRGASNQHKVTPPEVGSPKKTAPIQELRAQEFTWDTA